MTSSLSPLPKVIIKNWSRPHQHKNKRTDIAVVCDLFLTWKRKYFITGGNAYLLFFLVCGDITLWGQGRGTCLGSATWSRHGHECPTSPSTCPSPTEPRVWELDSARFNLVWWTPGHTPLEVCPGFLVQPKQGLFLHVCTLCVAEQRYLQWWASYF